MIDLHCHILPGIDDGAQDIETSLAMARIAVEDGIHTLACTPHIYPGMYENSAKGISEATDKFRISLKAANIPLEITYASDSHATPDLLERLRAGIVPTFNRGRYFLLEPPHHVAPPNFEDFVFRLMVEGYVPIVTHPERLHWIEDNYDVFVRLARKGAWMQITAGSLTGRFGNSAKYWGERMLDEGFVHILATDAHGVDRRPPLLKEGMEAAKPWVGAEEAKRLVVDRPLAALNNQDPGEVSPIPASANRATHEASSFVNKLLRWASTKSIKRV